MDIKQYFTKQVIYLNDSWAIEAWKVSQAGAGNHEA